MGNFDTVAGGPADDAEPLLTADCLVGLTTVAHVKGLAVADPGADAPADNPKRCYVGFAEV